jgi:hypothetical protein
MKGLMISVAALALMAGPALAQMSSSTTETTTTKTEAAPMVSAPIIVVPAPAPAPSVTEESGTSYESHKVTHSDNGADRVDSSSDKYVAPDGSTSTSKKVIEQDIH